MYIRAAGGVFGLFNLVLTFALFQLSRLATGAADHGIVALHIAHETIRFVAVKMVDGSIYAI